MRGFGLRQFLTLLLGGVVVWAIAAVLCLMVGSTGFFWPSGGVLWGRIEAVGLASLVGAALAGAGVAYQAILRNPLADPYLLGASSGAALAAYLWRFSFAAGVVSLAGALGQQGMAFAGALLSVGVVLALGSRRGRLDPLTLILVGVIVNSLNGALLLLVNQLNLDLPGGGGALNFLIGELQTNLAGWQIASAGLVIALCLAGLMALAGALSVASLGETEAQSLGLSVHRLRWGGLLLASLATAAGVAISGPIGFIGLLSPHIARLVVGSDVRRVMPVAIAIGAIVLCAGDAATRALAHQAALGTKLPVGVLTALIGGPAFLALLYRQRRQEVTS